MEYSLGIITHKKRETSLNLLLDRINSLNKPNSYIGLTITTDTKNSIWDTTCRSLKSYKGTHVVNLQDDMILSDDFFNIVDKAINIKPNNPIGLFSMTPLMHQAYNEGYGWIKSKGLSTIACTIFPVAMVDDFISYSGKVFVRSYTEDDFRLSVYCQYKGLDCFELVPSVVEHRDIKRVNGSIWKTRKASIFKNLKASELMTSNMEIERKIDRTQLNKYLR